MSETDRKSVIDMMMASLLWSMLQPGAICDCWWTERDNWSQWKGFNPQCQKPPVSFCPLSPAADHFSHQCVCVCLCVKESLEDRESCHCTAFVKWFLQGSGVIVDSNVPKQIQVRLYLSVNKMAVSEVIFGASVGNLAGLCFLYTRISS